jgi:hypothetical protein
MFTRTLYLPPSVNLLPQQPNSSPNCCKANPSPVSSLSKSMSVVLNSVMFKVQVCMPSSTSFLSRLLETAKTRNAERKACKIRGLLHGIPVTVIVIDVLSVQ